MHIDGLMQKRRNSIANTSELHLSCTNTSIGEFPSKKKENQSAKLPPAGSPQINTLSFGLVKTGCELERV